MRGMAVIRPLDVHALKAQFRNAFPFPHVVIDNFLEPDFAAQVATSYPDFQKATELGFAFRNVNENLKVQISEYEKFPQAAKQLGDALASPALMKTFSEISGIDDLLWDDTFSGGGMHQTASSGLLDVHVDFNLLESKQLYRRLNLLLYLNPRWEDQWGGFVELWDKDVKVCHRSMAPKFNRCLIFQTSEISFHGVTAVRCPQDVQRKSFAVYYYTREAAQGWAGRKHSTIFKARPDEYLKRYALMPAERAQKQLQQSVKDAKKFVKRLIG